jgi:hypothetical protein
MVFGCGFPYKLYQTFFLINEFSSSPANIQKKDNPWARWVWRVARDRPASALAARNLPGGHWKALCDLVPLYRSISKVHLGDGGCGFWLDGWLPLGALHAAMPAL